MLFPISWGLLFKSKDDDFTRHGRPCFDIDPQTARKDLPLCILNQPKTKKSRET